MDSGEPDWAALDQDDLDLPEPRLTRPYVAPGQDSTAGPDLVSMPQRSLAEPSLAEPALTAPSRAAPSMADPSAGTLPPVTRPATFPPPNWASPGSRARSAGRRRLGTGGQAWAQRQLRQHWELRQHWNTGQHSSLRQHWNPWQQWSTVLVSWPTRLRDYRREAAVAATVALALTVVLSMLVVSAPSARDQRASNDVITGSAPDPDDALGAAVPNDPGVPGESALPSLAPPPELPPPSIEVPADVPLPPKPSTAAPTPPQAPPAKPQPPPPPPRGTAYSPIEAERFGAQQGIVTQANPNTGGTHIGFISNGDWVRYDNVGFTPTEASTMVINASNGARQGRTGRVELRLDSRSNAPIASFTIPNNGHGNWLNFSVYRFSIRPVSGTHTVYLTFTSSQDEEFANLDRFTFESS